MKAKAAAPKKKLVKHKVDQKKKIVAPEPLYRPFKGILDHMKANMHSHQRLPIDVGSVHAPKPAAPAGAKHPALAKDDTTPITINPTEPAHTLKTVFDHTTKQVQTNAPVKDYTGDGPHTTTVVNEKPANDPVGIAGVVGKIWNGSNISPLQGAQVKEQHHRHDVPALAKNAPKKDVHKPAEEHKPKDEHPKEKDVPSLTTVKKDYVQ